MTQKSVAIVLLNEDNEILMVSRKDDHSNFGLIGGKVDPEDNDATVRTAIRETKEETGLDITNLRLILVCPEGTRMAYTYLADWSGEIHTDEPHVVKWGCFNTILEGSYREYNVLVKRSLDLLKVPVKMNENTRFVPVSEIKLLMKVREEAQEKINSYESSHCRVCGDTQPKHGFYPLFSITTGIYQTSGLVCNRCACSDETYLENFGEPKEVV